MDKQFSRSIGLLGEDNFDLIQDKVIAVFGLGGVGGTALEALARTGFKHFLIIDFDKVDPSNLNRQILYTQKDVGINKVDAAKERILSINPEVDVRKQDGRHHLHRGHQALVPRRQSCRPGAGLRGKRQHGARRHRGGL